MEANHITFQGIDSAECERFIKDIRKRARNFGRSRDNDWIIDLVSDCIKGTAWMWYVQLDPDISEDWGKLQMAMINRWPPNGPVGEGRASADIPGSLSPFDPPLEGGNIPAPAPAPALGPIPNILGARSSWNLNGTKTGIIRIDCPTGSETMYIPSFLTEVKGSKVFTPSTDRSKALLVEITQGCVHHPQEIRLLNSPDHRKFLGIAQEGRRNLGAGSTEQALLVTANWAESSAHPSSVAFLKTAVWSICPVDNTIRALWQTDGSEYLLKSVISSFTKRILFVSDAVAFRSQENNRGGQFPEVKLVFEVLS